MDNTKEKSIKADNLYMQLNASELSAIIMKGSPNSNDRDAGFCSGSSEGGDDFSIDHLPVEPSSSTDASEDTATFKITPVALLRNKRKSSEPSKLVMGREKKNTTVGPLKKRLRYTSAIDSGEILPQPTAHSAPALHSHWEPSEALPHELMPNPAHIFIRHPGVTTLHRVSMTDSEEQLEPLALVLKKPLHAETLNMEDTSLKATSSMKAKGKRKSESSAIEAASEISDSTSIEECEANATPKKPTNFSIRPQQRNYKNMTKERRIEANARERTRVHTISAAYETLRHAVPSYSSSQKLSKLSVLRVACSYILTLSRMAGHDYSEDHSSPSIASCLDAVTATIHTEGKVKRKKED